MMADIAVGVAVAVAAAAGACVRYIVGGYLNNDFPFGTIAVNMVASLALGVIAGVDNPYPLIVGVGALGALSTWSTAANEAAVMARSGLGSMAIGYLALSVSSCVLLAWFGLKLGAAFL